MLIIRATVSLFLHSAVSFYEQMHIHIYVCIIMYMYVHVCMYVCMYIYICMYICVCMCSLYVYMCRVEFRRYDVVVYIKFGDYTQSSL